MSLISIRLPDDVENGLSQEAEKTRRPKSEIARDAIVEYLKRQERERHLAGLEAAAKVLAHDAESRHEAAQIAEEFLPLENEALAVAESRARYTVQRSTSTKNQKRKK